MIDCTNPLGQGRDGLELALGYHISGGEQVASWAPGASVFKSFNQTGAENMAAAAHFPVRPAMFVAGDDDARKPVVLALIAKIGFDATMPARWATPAFSSHLACCGSTRR
jgi:8-hydroxy-5-deazaflavin:NADPH oxidoreductase